MNNEKNSVKKLNILLAVGMSVLYTLYCFVLVPLYRMLESDIRFSDTVLPIVAEVLFVIVELLAISVGYAVSIYIIYRFGKSERHLPALLFCGATLYKLAVNLLMSWMDEGFMIDSVTNDVWAALIIPLVLELVQYFIVIRLAMSALGDRVGTAYMQGKGDSDEGVFPFGKMLDIDNPMIRTAFYAAIVVFASKLLSRMVYDIVLTVAYGLPSAGEIPLMIIYYISDVFPGVICYLAMLFIFMTLFSRRKNDAD